MAHDIVVGVDTSEASRRAVAWACDLATVPRPDGWTSAPEPAAAEGGPERSPEGEPTSQREGVDSDPGARVVLCHVIPWSPFSFTTNEENAGRSARREAELDAAYEQVLDPLATLSADRGVTVATMARHGDTADVLGAVARSSGAGLVVVGRTGDSSRLRTRILGSYASELAMHCPVPVTVVP